MLEYICNLCIVSRFFNAFLFLIIFILIDWNKLIYTNPSKAFYIRLFTQKLPLSFCLRTLYIYFFDGKISILYCFANYQHHYQHQTGKNLTQKVAKRKTTTVGKICFKMTGGAILIRGCRLDRFIFIGAKIRG